MITAEYEHANEAKKNRRVKSRTEKQNGTE
jgi:hypothetical protein